MGSHAVMLPLQRIVEEHSSLAGVAQRPLESENTTT
jgi:hypothetical protein